MLNSIKTIIQGVIMGIVETIPGVSGSTLALIMGVYDKFVDLLHDFSSTLKEIAKFVLGKSSIGAIKKALLSIDHRFGGLLILGMLLGIGVFSHIMSFLLETYPTYTFAFFFGLILASIKVPLAQITVTKREQAIVLLSALLFFIFLGLNPAYLSGDPSKLLLFTAGFFSICAMVLPGVSGSFVLLLFGLYDYVIDSIKQLTKLSIETSDLSNLFVLGGGVIMGFALFVRVLKYALSKYPSYLMSFLAGLMIASLRVLWPYMIVYDKPSPDISHDSVAFTKVLPWQLSFTEMSYITLIIIVTVALVSLMNKKLVGKKDPTVTL